MRLIINGDDFGISHSCNLAMLDCFFKGEMSSASMMTNMAWAKEAAEMWKKNPDLSIGLHFCLTAGKPLSPASSLIKEDGNFDKQAVLAGRVSWPEVREELQAQYDEFIRLNGRKPDHLNAHHCLERLAGFQEILEEFARTHDLALRGNERPDRTRDLPFEEAAGRLLHGKGRSGSIQEIAALFTPEELESDAAFEVAAHPGYVDEDLIRLSSLTEDRVIDARSFTNPDLKIWMEENGIEKISFRDLRHRNRSDSF